MVVDLMVEVALQIMQDPESQMWADLTAILGDPLGPALVPVLNSSLAESAMEDPQGIRVRIEEKRGEILEAVKVLAAKMIVFNPHVPAPCLKNSTFCPEVFQNTNEEVEIQKLYKRAQEDPDFANDEFSSDLTESFFSLFASAFGLSDMTKILEKSVDSEETDGILSTMSKKGDLSTTVVAFLKDLSEGMLTTNVTTSVSPQKLVCLANITALMYEEPAVKTAWAQAWAWRRLVTQQAKVSSLPLFPCSLIPKATRSSWLLRALHTSKQGSSAASLAGLRLS